MVTLCGISIHRSLWLHGGNPLILLSNHWLPGCDTRDISEGDNAPPEVEGNSMETDQGQQGFRQSDLARAICLGTGEHFKGERCEHFDRTSWECKLLRDQPLAAVYEQRCLPQSEFYTRAHWILNRYPDHLKGEFIDLEEFIHGRHGAERHRKGILDYTVSAPTIHNMYSLVNLALDQEIQRELVKKGLIYRKRQCGNCQFLGPAESYECELEEVSSGVVGVPVRGSIPTSELSANLASLRASTTRLVPFGKIKLIRKGPSSRTSRGFLNYSIRERRSIPKRSRTWKRGRE